MKLEEVSEQLRPRDVALSLMHTQYNLDHITDKLDAGENNDLVDIGTVRNIVKSVLGIVKLCGYEITTLFNDAPEVPAEVVVLTETKSEPIKIKKETAAVSPEPKPEVPKKVEPKPAPEKVPEAAVEDAVVVSYETKHGYSKEATVKTAVGVIWNGDLTFELIENDKLNLLVDSLKLDDKIKFDNTTGSIANERLPKTFMHSTFKKLTNGKLTLRLRGYTAETDEKSLGTDKYLVKVFDAVALNKIKDKENTIALFEGIETPVSKLIAETAMYAVGKDGVVTGVIAIFEKEL